jgi:hypothetical protein
MKRAIFILMLALGGSAAAAPFAPLPGKQAPEPLRKPVLGPIRVLWNELNVQRVNEGLVGRKNATRDEQRVAETPMLQPRPLSGW